MKPSQAPTSAPPSAAAKPIVFVRADQSRADPGEVDAEPDRQPRSRAPRAARCRAATAGMCGEHDQHAEEPAAEAEDDAYSDRSAAPALRPKPSAPVDAAGHQRAARATVEQREADDRAGDALRERRLRDVGREVDPLRRVQRAVDLAGVEVRVDEVRAGLGLLRPEVVGVPEPGRTTWCPFRRDGSSSRVAACGGVEKSSSPLTSSVSTFESRTRLYRSSSGAAGHASASSPPPQTNAVAGVAEVRSRRAPPAAK